MKTINKNTGLIILLVALNLFSLVALWFSYNGGRSSRKGHEQKVERFLQKELNLDDKQFKTFQGLRNEHFEERMQLEKQIREKKRGLLRLINSDTSAINYPYEIGVLEEQKEKLFVEHLYKLKAICTPEQQQNLSKVFLRAMRPRRGTLPH